MLRITLITAIVITVGCGSPEHSESDESDYAQRTQRTVDSDVTRPPPGAPGPKGDDCEENPSLPGCSTGGDPIPPPAPLGCGYRRGLIADVGIYHSWEWVGHRGDDLICFIIPSGSRLVAIDPHNNGSVADGNYIKSAPAPGSGPGSYCVEMHWWQNAFASTTYDIQIYADGDVPCQLAGRWVEGCSRKALGGPYPSLPFYYTSCG
jgi:hypothetical protein